MIVGVALLVGCGGDEDADTEPTRTKEQAASSPEAFAVSDPSDVDGTTDELAARLESIHREDGFVADECYGPNGYGDWVCQMRDPASGEVRVVWEIGIDPSSGEVTEAIHTP